MRGSKDRVEVFKLSENLWFAGTAQLPPIEDAVSSNGPLPPPGGDSASAGGGGNSGGDSSGNHSTTAGDSRASYAADDPRDREARKEELLGRIRGGGLDEKTREALAEAASSAAAAAASAPAAAPASAPAPAVDPLGQQMEERLAEVGEFSARMTELKQVVKRKPAVGFPACCHWWFFAQPAPTPAHLPPIFRPPSAHLPPTFRPPSAHLLPTFRPPSPTLIPFRPPSAHQFFGMLPWVVEKRDPFKESVFGDNIGDMTCTYDRQSRRFYLSTYWSSGGGNNTYDKFGQTRRRGDVTVGAGMIVAASTTDDPTQPWNVFFIPGSFVRLLFVLSLFPHLSSPHPFSPFCNGVSVAPFFSHFLTSHPFSRSSAALHMPLPATAAPFQTVYIPALSFSPSSSNSPLLLLSISLFLLSVSSLSPPPHPTPPPPSNDGINSNPDWRAPLHSQGLGTLFLPQPPSALSPRLKPPSQKRWHQLQSGLEGASPLSSNDGINSNPDWRAPLHFNSSRLTTFLDYPQIGTDAYGFYVSVNQYSESLEQVYGAGIYAIAKSQLQAPENATILRFVVPYTASVLSPSYTIYPQKVAADGDYDYRHGGTMYFGWTGVNPNRGAPNETVLITNFTTVGAFAITGTSALGTPEAERLVEPHCAAVNTPPFFIPRPVEQKPGPVPTAWQMNSTIKPIGPSEIDARGVVVNPESRRMWVSFMSAFGKDMSAAAVVVRLRLSLRPQRKWRTLRVFLERFKVVGVGGGNSLIQGTIALNRHGVGIIAASLAGRSFYPSAAYATLNANVDVGRVVIAGPGKAPLDDYTGYRVGATEMRYGDYMTATVDEEGNAWAAVQYVAGQPRTEWSNWAAFVFKVDLQGGEGDGGERGRWGEWG
ncbi:unnamed protein product [Closterium sp. Naga37s-1]|nr:unnamed protein product [Closterium sp. Naga37s-1]